MATTLLFMTMLHLLLLLTPPVFVTNPLNTMSRVAVATRPLESKSHQDYVQAFKPNRGDGQRGFGSGEVESCLPKGLRHSSAPSRYTNYHTFGSTVCSTGKHNTSP
ncbi:hypothetical protein LOK49_LG01G00488 [Camellia lanceoleosa]|uniref:Uncharacterized protein n=1 Tax=Camellia lanceoleosa TaxID=1840588 RepID=A0ACC0J1I0_9ERIC|nr:hypothetical protein LOK49_LG01G00488 [Camellia lanceoleosa]